MCKQVTLRSSCVTLREWSHNLHPPSCSGKNLFSPVWELLEWWANRRYHRAWNNALWSNSSEKTSRPLKFTTDSNNSMGKSVSHGPMCLSGVSASERAESAWRMNRMLVGRHPDCSGVDTLPTTSFFWKGHQDASRTLEKLCCLRRGVRWRLTCASKHLVIMVKKKNQSRSYLNHLVHKRHIMWLKGEDIAKFIKYPHPSCWKNANPKNAKISCSS